MALNEKQQADYEMDHKALIRVIVRLKLKPLRKQIQALDFIDIEGIYKQLFAEPITDATAVKRRST